MPHTCESFELLLFSITFLFHQLLSFLYVSLLPIMERLQMLLKLCKCVVWGLGLRQLLLTELLSLVLDVCAVSFRS